MTATGSQARYENRRGQLQEYFDCTALDNWKQLTSDAPVSRIRQTVRQGRGRMRSTLLGWLPTDLAGQRLLDAGCGTGALAWAAAGRGADVMAVDLSPNLVRLAAERAPAAAGETQQPCRGTVTFDSGDMLSAQWGTFDHTVCMDSLIHYQIEDTLAALEQLTQRTTRSLLFTVAPASALLKLMHRFGQWLPRQDRSPDIQPIEIAELSAAIASQLGPKGWKLTADQRISAGFYTSHALRLARP